MKLTVLIPHWKTAKMTAYAVAQFLKYKGDHELDIIVIDNHQGDGSTKYLEPFERDIQIINYPSDLLQSHGIAFDYALAMHFVKTPYFFTAESDSFPTRHGWLDYYSNLINSGYEAAGSVLKLSGGTYMHPCGAIYSTEVWKEANKYCNALPYWYFPNMAMMSDFPCHLMVHKDILDDFLQSAEEFVQLSDSYLPYLRELAERKRYDYLPTVGPFHNGMGGNQENRFTYGDRTFSTEVPTILEKSKRMVWRMGYEPGQWLSYWMKAMQKRMYEITTTVHWLPGKEHQQQERTVNVAGFTHLWGISAYHDYHAGDPDIAKVKQSLPDQLYHSLPEHLKI